VVAAARRISPWLIASSSRTSSRRPRSAATSSPSFRTFTPRTELPFAGHPTVGTATGSGSATLAGCLADRAPTDGTFTWHIDQGVAMGRPSLLEASAEKRRGRTVAVMVGGPTVLVGKGSMTVPPGF